MTARGLVLAAALAFGGGAALAQAVPPAPSVSRPPPPPGRGLCTPQVPCTAAHGERFYYTPSGDRRYLSK